MPLQSKGPKPDQVPGPLAGDEAWAGANRRPSAFSYGNTPTGEASPEPDRLLVCARGWRGCLPLQSVFVAQATLMVWGPTLTVMSTCPPRAVA